MATGIVFNLNSFGHVNPSLPLITELVRRGERIIYYGLEQNKKIIEATGAQYRPYEHPELLTPKTHQGEFFGVMAHNAEAAQSILPSLLVDIKELTPDYILLDSMCLWGNLVQQITGLSAITFSSIFMMPKSMAPETLMDMAYGERPKDVLFAGLKNLYRYFTTAQKIDNQYGCVSPGLVGAFTNVQDVNIIFTSKVFHPMNQHYDESIYKFVGPSIAPRVNDIAFPLDLIDAKNTIYISLGTINNDHIDFYKKCYEAFSADGDQNFSYRVVLSVGSSIDIASIGDVPSNFIVRAQVPQLEILKRCAVFVSHGGMNSTSESLFYGVPMLVIPHRGDQFLVAEQVEANNAGIRLMPSQVTAASLRDGVFKLLASETFKQGAENMRRSFISAGGYLRAADEVMRYTSTLKVSDELVEESLL